MNTSVGHKGADRFKSYLFHELHCFPLFDTPNGAHFLVIEHNTVEVISSDKHLRSEGRSDELCR